VGRFGRLSGACRQDVWSFVFTALKMQRNRTTVVIRMGERKPFNVQRSTRALGRSSLRGCCSPPGPYSKRLNLSAQLSTSSPLLSLSYSLNFLLYSRKNGNTLNHLPKPPLPNPPKEISNHLLLTQARLLRRTWDTDTASFSKFKPRAWG